MWKRYVFHSKLHFCFLEPRRDVESINRLARAFVGFNLPRIYFHGQTATWKVSICISIRVYIFHLCVLLNNEKKMSGIYKIYRRCIAQRVLMILTRLHACDEPIESATQSGLGLIRRAIHNRGCLRTNAKYFLPAERNLRLSLASRVCSMSQLGLTVGLVLKFLYYRLAGALAAVLIPSRSLTTPFLSFTFDRFRSNL